jgi:Domain of unknown function DUF11
VTPVNLVGAATSVGNTVSWMTNTLPVGGGASIVFTGTITGTGTLVNSVTIASSTPESQPANNSATSPGLTVAGSALATNLADLWLGMESTPASIPLHTPVEYILLAGNQGPLGVEGATLEVQSAGELVVRLAGEPGSGCPRLDGIITCRLPSLPPGGVIRIAVAVPTAVAGPVVSVWTLYGAPFDPNPEDNRLEARWMVGESERRYFLPFLQSGEGAARSQTEEIDLFLPAVSGNE